MATKLKNFGIELCMIILEIDLVIVFEIIPKDLKSLNPQFEKIIKKKFENKIFDIEELKISKKSKYYQNIDFEELI